MTESKKQKIEVEIYTIHSQKGGVGKTSVALAKAGWSALEKGKRTLIIDGDITGTSLIDIFNMDKPWYLNDLLLSDPIVFRHYKNNPARVENNFCIPDDNYKNIFFMPSSPILEDIKVIVSLISQEDKLHFFQSRTKDILELLVKNKFETIIIDTPPGLYGMSKAMREMELNGTKGYEYKKQTIFVVSSDRSDYRALFSTLSRIYLNEKDREEWLKACDILFNKFSTVGSRDPVFKLTEILNDLKSLQGNRKVDEKILEKIKDTASLTDKFEIGRIIETINHLINHPESREHLTPFQKWCLELRNIDEDVKKDTSE